MPTLPILYSITAIARRTHKASMIAAKSGLFILSFLISSCSAVESHLYNLNNSQTNMCFDEIMVPRENNILFTKFSNYPQNQNNTRSSSENELVSLESLIDRNGAQRIVFKNYQILQIPFRRFDEGQVASLADMAHEVDTKVNVSAVRKFLVEINDTLARSSKWIVATLVPTPENCKKFGPDSYSYINKDTFEGIILYSNLDGSLRSIQSYGLRPIREAYLIDPPDSFKYDRIRFINIFKKDTKTRGEIDGGELEASICIGEQTEIISSGGYGSSFNNDDLFNRNTEPPTIGNHNGGSGVRGGDCKTNPSKGSSDESHILDSSLIVVKKPRKDNEDDDVIWYTVSLSSIGNGYTIGSGRYSKRETQFIICEAIPSDSAYFDRWTGDFNRHGAILEFIVSKDISSTAYFADIVRDTDNPYDPLNRPCFNDSTGVGNPLNSMSIASPGQSGFRGGTFGYVRNSDTKFHSGLDLLAQEGTPVYAMIDGIISNNGYVVSQPNRDPSASNVDAKGYPLDYSGDKNGAGNRISIQGNKNGSEVMVGYWHLRAENPIAINPRTQIAFKPGDTIFRGELLGYTGRTGNAFNVTNKHLHLIYKIKSINGKYQYANPEDIINGFVNWKDKDSSSKEIIDGMIIDIKCDTEDKRNNPLL